MFFHHCVACCAFGVGFHFSLLETMEQDYGWVGLHTHTNHEHNSNSYGYLVQQEKNNGNQHTMTIEYSNIIVHDMAMAMVLSTTSQPYNILLGEIPPFDTNSQLLGINKWCSACIMHVQSDLLGALQSIDQRFGGA